ncbi:hypothetical protein [Nitrosopumilus sp.]|uniref:hypothetical protein n=1 Tax=Nitrosopumilus sp. TaxID=2024843 RepID=UPI00293008D1|nr:hypothetical protein [Nitrosopumilus sp.]
MKTRKIILMMILSFSMAGTMPQAFSEPTISIIMEKTTYTYCEKLFYTIEVSEITGDPAVIHLKDNAGKGSSAIPIPITKLQNPVPSLVAFQEEVFPLGKYFIDVQYSGAETTAEFNLIDSDKICIPELIKPITSNWLTGNISDGFLIDAFQKYIDQRLINVPFEINEKNVYDIDIPDWVKNTGYWWIQGVVSDEEFAQCVNYLIEKDMITSPAAS